MRSGELEEINILGQLVNDWDRAQKIRKFTDALESKVHDVEDPVLAEKLLKWIEWARDKADWIDPLVDREDKVLGKGQNIYDIIHKFDPEKND